MAYLSGVRGFAAAAALAVGAMSPLTAETIFDTGEPVGPAGYSIFNYGPGAFNQLAARFTLTGETRITAIDGWFGTASANANQIDISIHANSANGPGNELATDRIAVPGFSPGAPDFNWVRAFTGGPVVLGPGDYWVSFVPNADVATRCDCWMPANAPNIIPFGAYMNSFTGGNWSQRELYFGLRIFGDRIGGVPEPASWAMMLAGFGIAGGALRRRKSAMAFAV